MRLRITRQLDERIDGILLSAFRPGYVYEVGTTIGSYFLATGAAEPVSDDEPHIILSPDKQLFLPCAPPAPLPKSNCHIRHDDRAAAVDWAPRRPNRLRRLRLPLNARTIDLEARVTALATELGHIKRTLKAHSNG